MLTKQDLQQIEKLVTGSEELVTKNLTKRIDQLDDKISTLDDKISTLTDKIEATKQEIIEGVNDLIQNSIIPQLDDKVGRTEYKKDISQIRSHLGLISK